MKRINFYILVCFAGILGAAVTLALSQNWACILAIIIFIPGIALSLESYYREKREKEEKIYAEIIKKEKTLNDFRSTFNIDWLRAEQLYLAGYRELADFRGRSAQELMKINEINPTLANRIVRKMNEH